MLLGLLDEIRRGARWARRLQHSLISPVVMLIVGLLSIPHQAMSDDAQASFEKWRDYVEQNSGVLVEVFNPSLYQMYLKEQKIAGWPDRRKKLETLLENSPNGPIAGDLAMLIACGIAYWEEDYAKASALFKDIADNSADGHCIGIYYNAGFMGLQTDQRWLDFVHSFLTGDGRMIYGAFCDDMGSVWDSAKPTLQYFDHYDAYPIYTKDVAILNRALVEWTRGNRDEAKRLLDDLTEANYERMCTFAEADRKADWRRGRGFPSNNDPRPIEQAHIRLMGFAEHTGQLDKAIAVGEKLVSAVSPDGWRYELNERLGNLYLSKADEAGKANALSQFRICHTAYLEECRKAFSEQAVRRHEEAVRLNKTDGEKPKWEDLNKSWEHGRDRYLIQIRRKIESAGGTLDPEGSEFESLQMWYERDFTLPEKKEAPKTEERPTPAPSPELLKAVDNLDTVEISKFLHSHKPADKMKAIKTLAEYQEGCNVLFDMLNQEEHIGKPMIREILIALKSNAEPETYDRFGKIALTAVDVDVRLAAAESYVKGMPEESGRAYCLSQLEDLSKSPDNEQEKTLLYMRALPKNGDKGNVDLIGRILHNTSSENIQIRCIKILSQCRRKEGPERSSIGDIIRQYLDHTSPAVRSAAQEALKE